MGTGLRSFAVSRTSRRRRPRCSRYLVEQQVLWLRTGEGTGQDKQGSQIKAPHLRGLAEYVQRVLDAGRHPEDRTMEYIDCAGDRHASYFTTLELRAQELIRTL